MAGARAKTSLADTLREYENSTIQGIIRALDDAQLLVVGHIEGRTLRGRDVQGKPFAAYSRRYAKLKGKKRPNLFDTGQMLDALDARRKDEFRREVFLRGREANRKGVIHQEGYVGTDFVEPHTRTQTHWFGKPVTPRKVEVKGHDRTMFLADRKWFGTTKAAEAKVAELFDKAMKKAGEETGGLTLTTKQVAAL